MTDDLLTPSDTFPHRHIGPSEAEINEMLQRVGASSLDALSDETVPASIRDRSPVDIADGRTESELLVELSRVARKNRIHRSFIGMGYYDCITPPVILRNVLEDPGWYTPYTPYQPEISQGRLEALLNFQTMVSDLTGLPLANASLLDEATAAAEAVIMCRAVSRGKKNRFFAADDCHPQTLAVVRTRTESLGMDLVVGPIAEFDPAAHTDLAGVLIQYPNTHGRIFDHSALAARVRDAGALLCVATDLLALTLLRPPGEFGADIAVGSSQRFGVPMGAGGPHAAFLATREQYKRQVPGRLIGVSRDAHGQTSYRLALQTREQHIRRARATSNICTAQALLAVVAGMYAVYHGPDGLRRIARRVHAWAEILASGLNRLGFDTGEGPFFDTVRVDLSARDSALIAGRAAAAGMNLRQYPDGALGIALDETTGEDEVSALWRGFSGSESLPFAVADISDGHARSFSAFPEPFARHSDFLGHDKFHSYHSEHELLRYINRLKERDVALTRSMIPLGSCTMKLNGTSEMIPVTWPEFGRIHPYAPQDQVAGYSDLVGQLKTWLAEITGFSAVSLQPNSGAQGEFTGLLAIRAYHTARGEGERTICLIPTSAHGTNPASAVMAGLDVVAVECDDQGNIDVTALAAKARAHSANLAALMITYPSTHGVFEAQIREICEIIHEHGGQVYLDGANLNAQLGLCRPGDYGADICHLNLHKTFCIPHGGGGPGMGPVACAEHLAPFLPGDPLGRDGGDSPVGPVAAAPHGSPSILPISWVYIALMGNSGLTRATQVAILNANYMAARLRDHYAVLYTGPNGRVAHEFVIDCRPFKKSAGIEVDDIAKRLMDFGFHAPTMSWPVPGTLMIEPTESESRAELDRYCDAMIAIREEIEAIAQGKMDRVNNPLKNAPHTAHALCADQWERPYSREQAGFPLPWVKERKYWPPVGRIDNAYGDRNLVCTCPSVDEFTSS
ncbi:MAG: aminomethyl-transferring glycine dehydrogenase [Proteobacteria bacterium]|nr:aminomethyl-transferring glycine dehydrogenase [Pseudomonadota bacterium]